MHSIHYLQVFLYICAYKVQIITFLVDGKRHLLTEFVNQSIDWLFHLPTESTNKFNRGVSMSADLGIY